MSLETPILINPSVEAPEIGADKPAEIPPTYAGFWKRVLAFLIDYIVMLLLIVLFSYGISAMMRHNGVDLYAGDETVLYDVAMQLMVLFIGLFYCAAFESTQLKATVGKLLVGIQVTDLHGQQLSFWRALGRHLGKYLSFLLFGLGFLMVAFNRQKRGLHDFMAGCLVINHPH